MLGECGVAWWLASTRMCLPLVTCYGVFASRSPVFGGEARWPVPKAYLQKCVPRAMPEGGMGPLLTMSALGEVQACISNFWSGPNRTLPTRRFYP